MAEAVKKTIKIERKYIDVDTTYANVLQWDKEGHRLVFLSEPDLFINLTEAQTEPLSASTKTSYRLAKADFKTNNKSFTNSSIEALNNGIEYGTATEKLNVTRDPKSKNELKWIRPEQIREFNAKGWNVVTSKMESQRGLRDTGYHSVGKNELILMEISKVKYAALEEVKQKNRTQLFEHQAETIQEQATMAGVNASYQTSSEDIRIPLM